MKPKVLFFFFLVILSKPILSQNYDSIVQTTKVWNTLIGYIGGDIQEHPLYTGIYKIEGDTIINSIPFKKLFESDDSLKTWFIAGYIREKNKRIYYTNIQLQTGLLYDFNLKVNDSVKVVNRCYNRSSYPLDFDTTRLKVTSIDTFEWNSVKRIRYKFLHYGQSYYDEWIEGIGSIYGLLSSGYHLVAPPGGFRDLLCVSQSNSQIYFNTTRNSCYITPQPLYHPNNERSKNTTIYPNPASRILSLSVPGNTSEIRINLFNTSGRLVFQNTTIDLQIELPLLPDGVYFYTLVIKGKCTNGKIVIKQK